MKIDRLLGIVMILLQKDKVTAPYLAEKFEVSRRTINRDIEDLCMAGIPIITLQGGNGGITIADGYRIDKSILTYDEMQNVVAALKGLGSITSDVGTEKLLNKFFIKQDNVLSVRDSIIINLTSHYKSDLTEKITSIKDAIHNNFRISFHYYSNKGDNRRTIEPYYLTFQWSAWYVFGYCMEKKDFRLFKLNRLWELVDTTELFQPREIPEERKDFESYFSDEIQITMLFDESVKYRLIDDYGVDSYSVTEDGKLMFRMSFTNKEFMVSWILGFGDKAEVLFPKGLKQEIKQIAENIIKRYE
ncbi:MAG: DNA-binding transcriptional regulator [Herbinix sp.]|jgi:predicted DNA-binding transcriptional regulator YafY|nr:DNA-binding transcriptional regulator [Herbinix sp.]